MSSNHVLKSQNVKAIRSDLIIKSLNNLREIFFFFLLFWGEEEEQQYRGLKPLSRTHDLVLPGALFGEGFGSSKVSIFIK